MSTPDVETRGRGGLSGVLAGRVRRDASFFGIAIGIFLFDWLTKAIVRANLAIGESWPEDGWLVKITHVTNSGAAFGILQGQELFLTVTAIIAIGAIVFYYVFPPLEHGLLRLSLGLLLGGAAGNLMDRVRFGAVTDFVDFHRYPNFNVADSAIVIGLFVIAVFFILSESGRLEQEKGNEHDSRDSA